MAKNNTWWRTQENSSGLYLGAGRRWLFLCSVLTWGCDVIWSIFTYSWRLLTLLALKVPRVRTTATCPAFLWQDSGVFPNQESIYCSTRVNWTHIVYKITWTNHISRRDFALCWKRSNFKGWCLPFLPTGISCGRSSVVMKKTLIERQVKCRVANYHPKHSSCISLLGLIILLINFLQQPSLKPNRIIIFQII